MNSLPQLLSKPSFKKRRVATKYRYQTDDNYRKYVNTLSYTVITVTAIVYILLQVLTKQVVDPLDLGMLLCIQFIFCLYQFWYPMTYLSKEPIETAFQLYLHHQLRQLTRIKCRVVKSDRVDNLDVIHTEWVCEQATDEKIQFRLAISDDTIHSETMTYLKKVITDDSLDVFLDAMDRFYAVNTTVIPHTILIEAMTTVALSKIANVLDDVVYHGHIYLDDIEITDAINTMIFIHKRGK